MGKVVHFEIPASDLPRMKEFYASVFGWHIEPFNEWYMSAKTATSDENGMSQEKGAINGGIQKRSWRAKSPTIVIGVSSITESIEKIRKAGGYIAVPKEEIPDIGFYAQFDDIEGNRIGLFQSLVQSEGKLKIGCRELGGDCDYVAMGKSAEEVKNDLFRHAREAHPEKLASMNEAENEMMLRKMDELLGKG